MITLRAGGYQPPTSILTLAMRDLAARIPEALGGRCRIDLTEDVTRSGRRAAELFAMVEGGDLDLCYFSSAYLVARVPELAVFDRPFPALGRSALLARLDGGAGSLLARAVAERTGLRVLAYWDNGVRHMSNRRGPIRGPADCAGLSIRTLNSAIYLETFRALGAIPRFVDPGDLRRVVLAGEVDAQENPLTSILAFGLHEAHRHVSLTGHFHGICLVLANRERFDALPAPIREGLLTVLDGVTVDQRERSVAEDRDALAALRASGTEVLGPEDVDRPAFAALVRPVAEALESALSPEVRGAFAA